ncbi:hypothetical protein PIB30_096040 [Stylosanthes scabra]|uniref:C2H2-type domain-containing protein n=1 Tax=Stylosanthes scabra TaxID=79078 RepID=A0ABU6UUP9_9FABA|nr:hypothetical protein [Stylosanthes scabra]
MKCQLWIIIYRREAPDVSFQMKVELHRLKLCRSSYCHFSPERSSWKTHQSIHGLRAVDPRAVDPRICVDFHAYAWTPLVQLAQSVQALTRGWQTRVIILGQGSPCWGCPVA